MPSKRNVVSIILIFVLISSFAFEITNANFMVDPLPNIYIKEDGSIEPKTAPIQRNGRTYTLTGDITKYELRIKCDNIILDGKGHTLLGRGIGPGTDTAITIADTRANHTTINRQNVIIKNFNIEKFGRGIYAPSISGCVITENTIKNGQDGILTGYSAENNKITYNTISGGLQDYGCGIRAFGSYNSVIGNNISNLRCGIEFDSGDHNKASNNILSNIKEIYIDISSAPDTVLENNVLPLASPSPTATSATITPTTPSPTGSDYWSNPTFLALGVIVIVAVVSVILIVRWRHQEKS